LVELILPDKSILIEKDEGLEGVHARTREHVEPLFFNKRIPLIKGGQKTLDHSLAGEVEGGLQLRFKEQWQQLGVGHTSHRANQLCEVGPFHLGRLVVLFEVVVCICVCIGILVHLVLASYILAFLHPN
jgi:hypothetical protein